MENSLLHKMLLSHYLSDKEITVEVLAAAHKEGEIAAKLNLAHKQDAAPVKVQIDARVNVTSLMIYAVLYAEATNKVRAQTFLELMEQVPDKKICRTSTSLRELYPKVLEMATLFIYQFTQLNNGKALSDEARIQESDRMKTVYGIILHNFLNDMFGTIKEGDAVLKITTEQFVNKMESKKECLKYMDPKEI